jgi:hypothetical protein
VNISELFNLSEWYRSYFPKLSQNYKALHQVISSNAQQPSQQPIDGHLSALQSFLESMDIGQLSLQQTKVLQDLNVLNLIGHEGVSFVEKIVRTTAYDPATSAANLSIASQNISSANDRLTAYFSAVKSMALEPNTIDEYQDRIIVRVGFKKQASINNVTDWKDSSKDWYDIVRGLALAASESPEDTKIVGATNGSIILILAATTIVTSLLARISTHAVKISLDVIKVQSAVEDLRQKRLLTQTMENELKKQEKSIREDGIKVIQAEVRKQLPEKTDGEVINALDSSIAKLLAFGEKGGDIDFVAPPENETEAEVEENPSSAADPLLDEFKKVRAVIHEYQHQRENLKLLEHKNMQNETASE